MKVMTTPLFIYKFVGGGCVKDHGGVNAIVMQICMAKGNTGARRSPRVQSMVCHLNLHGIEEIAIRTLVLE